MYVSVTRIILFKINDSNQLSLPFYLKVVKLSLWVGTSTMAVPAQLVVVLNDLNNNVSPQCLRRGEISLFLHCMDHGGQKLEKVETLLEIYQLILPCYKELAIPLLQYILDYVKVKDADRLEASTEGLVKAKELLSFPSLLVRIC